MDQMKMLPRRPYILRAIYDWLLDNNLTPYLVVDVTLPSVQVPLEFVRNGQIVLNIAPRAVGNLELGNDEVRLNARFGGVPRQLYIPVYAVMAIYGQENGAGIMFEPEEVYETDLQGISPATEPRLAPVDSDQTDDNDEPDDTPPKPPRGRPSLRVIK